MSLKPFCEVPPESKDARIARLERELEAAISRLSEARSENATLWEMLTDIERWADAIKNRAQGKRLVHKYEQAKAEREAAVKRQRQGADSPCAAGSSAPSTESSSPASQGGARDAPSDVQRGAAQSAPATKTLGDAVKAARGGDPPITFKGYA